ncbi:serine/threonine-protein kinase D6PK-like protein [Tanacetum coccineum]
MIERGKQDEAKTSDSGTFVGQVKEVKVLIPKESTSMATSSRTMPDYLQGGPKMKSSYSNSPQSSVQFNKKEKSLKRVRTRIWQNEFLCEPESRNVLPMIESALHAKKCVAYDEPSKPVVNGSKANSKLGKSIKLVKTVIRNKNIVKKKSKQDLPFATSVIENVTFVPDTCQLVCERCHCALKELNPPPCTRISSEVKHGFSQIGCGSNGFVIFNNTNFKYGDKSDFSQTSNSSSMCEYSSSTSISEESSKCSIGNRPHMSMDSRRQAIHDMMKWNSGFLGLRLFNLLNKLGCGDTSTLYLAELVGTNLQILDHPFLPTLYAHFVSDNLSCLVMDYCPGGNLHVLRQKKPDRYYHEQAASSQSLEFPDTPLVSFQARDLIKGLLVKEPENRLGSQKGAAEFKQHPFFNGLNWALIRCANPPEVPVVSMEKATKCVDYNGAAARHPEFELF